ncbi:MAG: OmpA family protein [Gemmatimonadales bacterium]
MQGPIVNLVTAAGLIASLGGSALGAQQQVKVTVAAVPNPITAGSCTRIWADVRDELNRQLTLENGVPLQWGSYDYTMSNGTDFEWRSTGSQEFELCAKPGVGAVSTEVTATIKGMPYSGTALVSVAPGTPGGVAPGVASATPPAAGAQPPTPTSVPAQPYTPSAAPAPPAQAYSPPAQAYSPPAQTYAPPAPPATAPPSAVAAQPQAAPAQPVEAQPVKSGGGFFKKLGSHLKQKATEVKAETAQNLTTAATSVVDTTFQTGSRLVASTTAEVTSTARLGIGGVGQKLMLAPQRAGGSADNLALAISSGHAVLLELRFTPGTSVLEPSARDLVQRLGAELRKAMAEMPAARFEINAHVESPADQVLSESRAGTVKALLSNQADARRLTALGYGASQPLNGVPTARIEIVRCNDGQTKCLMEVAP